MPRIVVSIPSERESALQDFTITVSGTGALSFNSLRTGKCFARKTPRSERSVDRRAPTQVSIPSERESALQVSETG